MATQYLVRQPKKLEDLAMRSVGDWIAIQAATLMRDDTDNEEISRYIEHIRSTIEFNVPGLLHNQLFDEGVRALTALNNTPSTDVSEARKENVTSRMTESLFTKHLSVLEVFLDSSIFQTALYNNAHLLVGVTELRLNAFEAGLSYKEHEMQVSQILKGLHNLKKLSYRGSPFTTDKIITCIVENCKLLEEFDIVGSTIRFKQLYVISKLSHLKRINIEYTSLLETEIVNILKYCKNIEYIFNGSNTLVTALEHIKATSAKDTKPQFNLKIYHNHMRTTFEQVQLIVSMCPKVKRVILNKFIDSHFSLNPLLDLQYLQELELRHFDFYDDQVKDVLEIRGQNLTGLYFEAVRPMNLNELMYVARICPNLECLKINKSEIYEPIQPQSITALGTGSKAKTPTFGQLRSLMFQDDDIEMPVSMLNELIFLLSNSPRIEFIDTWVPINDEVISTVLDANPLLYLQKLKIYQSNLSRQTIDRITQSCLNFPEIINRQ